MLMLLFMPSCVAQGSNNYLFSFLFEGTAQKKLSGEHSKTSRALSSISSKSGKGRHVRGHAPHVAHGRETLQMHGFPMGKLQN